MKLQNKQTILIDDSQSVLTGNYELVGQVAGTSNKYIVRCPDTNAIHIVELNLIDVI
jgi:hypothetical protein